MAAAGAQCAWASRVVVRSMLLTSASDTLPASRPPGYFTISGTLITGIIHVVHLANHVVAAHVISVVAREDNERVVVQALALKRVDHQVHLPVNERDVGIIGGENAAKRLPPSACCAGNGLC